MPSPAPTPPARRRFLRLLPLVLGLLLLVPGTASAFRVMDWNILRYPSNQGDSREDDHRVVVGDIQPDLIVVQEITTTAGATEWLNDVLNTLEPGQWAMAPFTNGTDTDNACYYRPAMFTYISNVVLNTALRQIDGWTFRPVGYGAGAEFSIYSMHLKASQGSENEDKREAEVQILRNHLNAKPAGTHFIVAGDTNIYSSSEGAWSMLTGSQADNDGRVFDPIDDVGNWHSNSSYADIHTQSTRSGSLGDGGASGGMDDRFDFILLNDDFEDGEGLDYIPGTYKAWGQDGNRFNQSINTGTNTAVSAAVADALYFASDHLPVVMDVQLPALVAVSGVLAFGDVLQGATVSSVLTVENEATAPADDLDYSLVPSPGFTAPAGSFSLAAGGLDLRTVDVDTSTPADLTGAVTVVSDDPDTPFVSVNASATVLAASQPSLDGGVAQTADTVDWGIQPLGGFSPLPVDLHNLGYGSLQALLEVYDAQITGPDAARFSVSGFSSTLVGATPASFDLVFDDTGGPEGIQYTATLTFKTRDDSGVVGGQDRADLLLSLSAEIEDSGTPAPVLPGRTALHANVPNPFNPATVLSFDLARAGAARLVIHDVRGRQVRTLVDGTLDAGRHQRTWDGRADDGSGLASGVYFYRLVADGQEFTRRMTLVR